MINILFFVQICLELLPISSSGHIELFCKLYPHYPHLSKILYTFAHLLTACIMLFFLKNFLTKWLIVFSLKRKMCDLFLLFISLTITGFFLLLKSNFTIAIPLWYGFFLTAFLLFLLNFYIFYEEREYVTFYDSLIIGLTQGVAGCFPGLSRFAAILFICQVLGYTKKYSFTIASLLGITLSFAANLFLMVTNESYFSLLYDVIHFLTGYDIAMLFLSLLFAIMGYFSFIEGYFNRTLYYIGFYEIILAMITYLVYVL